MTEDEVRTLLHQRGLARVADALLTLAAPTIRIYTHRTGETAIPVGASKVGGQPDLPPGVAWPSWHEPMAFIAQVNLATVASYDRESVLPRQGLLSFFYETDGEPLYAARWGLPEDAAINVDAAPPIDEAKSWCVLYHPENPNPTTFIRHSLPPTLNERVRFPACTAHFAAELSLPDADSPEVWPLRLTEDERGALIDLQPDVNHGAWPEGGHRLLGYPYNVDGPTLVECDAAARGVSDEWGGADDARRLEIERDAAQRWRLLLQVSSSDEADMDWAGGGVLHYCIARTALQRHDFSRVWVNMQFL